MSKENCESEARKKIAASIGATPEEIYFTSGRADGHLKALKAVVKASKKARPHVIITTMEDPEVLDECSRLERKDAVVTYLDPITTGRVEVAMIENELKENTELISVTAANCQTGTSEPFTGIGTMTSEKGVIFHTDAAFAFGKMPINVERSHIDMLTADASYFGGPENAGFLYVRKMHRSWRICVRNCIKRRNINSDARYGRKFSSQCCNIYGRNPSSQKPYV